MSLDKIIIRSCDKPFIKGLRQVIRNFNALLPRRIQRKMRQKERARLTMQRYRRRQKRRQAASPRGKRLIPIQNINIYMYMNGVPHLIGHADKGTIRPKGSR